ncbi:hypothetical protein [Shinella sp.]|uniref:hypothetical protein n=1 Tax=Shinella sp. TaxID=1870904 RepID=UPI00301DE962
MVATLIASSVCAQEVLDNSVGAVGDDKANAAMSAVMARLRDPMSAQFKSFTHPDSMYQQYPQNIVCGMVNAKNGFGGYNSFTPFAYHVLNKTTIILADSILASAGGELSKLAFKSTSCASALGVSL